MTKEKKIMEYISKNYTNERLSSLEELDFSAKELQGSLSFDFVLPKLKYLYCHDNEEIENIDLSKTPNLEILYCYNNKLKSLNLNNLRKLKKIDCAENRLTTLDLSELSELKEVACSFNDISNLILKNPKLEDLRCQSNKIKSLDLTQLPNLKKLNCCYNPLGKLDLSSLPKLEKIKCHNANLNQIFFPPDGKLNCMVACFNRLNKLKLPRLPELNELRVFDNQLVEADISRAPNLTNLEIIRGNRKLSKITISEKHEKIFSNWLSKKNHNIKVAIENSLEKHWKMINHLDQKRNYFLVSSPEKFSLFCQKRIHSMNYSALSAPAKIIVFLLTMKKK